MEERRAGQSTDIAGFNGAASEDDSHGSAQAQLVGSVAVEGPFVERSAIDVDREGRDSMEKESEC